MQRPGLDTTAGTQPEGESPPRPWWAQWEVLLLAGIVAGGYVLPMRDLTLRGEEPCRAQVAVEMIQTGDWLVPRRQGRPFLDRPPLQNWAIALLGLVRGRVDVVAIRAPSAASILLAVLLVYGYARTCLPRPGAFAAAAALATMGHVLEMGGLGETEAMFTFLLSASLLVWHWGMVRGRPAWLPAYALMALATLTKGLQAPVYFFGAIGLYLLITRRLRELLSAAHLGGLIVGLLLWAAWQVPYSLEMGWHATRETYLHVVTMRFGDSRIATYVRHAAVFPAELFASMLPWSLMLAAYAAGGLRRALGGARPHVSFMLCCIAVALPTCWGTSGARPRYLMPIYPCLALLIGVAIQRCWDAAPPTAWWQKTWRRTLLGLGAAMPLGGAAVLVASLLGDRALPVAQPLRVAVVYAGMGALLGAAAIWSARGRTEGRRLAGVLAVAAFMVVTYTGPVATARIRASEDVAPRIARLKARLPAGANLVSFGPVHPLFGYYYRDPIPPRPWPKRPADAADVQYFCVECWNYRPRDRNLPKPLPFPWKQVGVYSLERNRHRPPRHAVVVGVRLPGPKPRRPPSATAQSRTPPRKSLHDDDRPDAGYSNTCRRTSLSEAPQYRHACLAEFAVRLQAGQVSGLCPIFPSAAPSRRSTSCIFCRMCSSVKSVWSRSSSHSAWHARARRSSFRSM